MIKDQVQGRVWDRDRRTRRMVKTTGWIGQGPSLTKKLIKRTTLKLIPSGLSNRTLTDLEITQTPPLSFCGHPDLM